MKKTLILTSEDVRALPACERVGLVYPWFGPDAARLVKTVVSAEAAGVRQVWSTQGPVQDTLTAFAAAGCAYQRYPIGYGDYPHLFSASIDYGRTGSGTRRPGSGTASARYRFESSAHYRRDIWHQDGEAARVSARIRPGRTGGSMERQGRS